MKSDNWAIYFVLFVILLIHIILIKIDIVNLNDIVLQNKAEIDQLIDEVRSNPEFDESM